MSPDRMVTEWLPAGLNRARPFFWVALLGTLVRGLSVATDGQGLAGPDATVLLTRLPW